ncbi:hypothetical protein Tco_0658775 [Tanacetum coccineum]
MMSTLKFAETHNLVAFLEKPKESNGFEGIIDFLNACSIKYTLTVNPTVYESCIQQFWATVKAKTVNREHQIQALVDKKKVIITEKSVRSDLMLEDAEGTECLPADLDADEEVTLIDETQERFDEEMLFDVQDNLQGEEVVAEKEVAEKEVSAVDPVTTTSEVVTTASTTTTIDELTLAQTLIKIKAAKLKTVTTAATTITTAVASTRQKAKGIIFHD